jgi:2-oxo-3-hexenedioate decarboxylase
MLADELIDLHARPREVAPFSQRHPGLSPRQGYQAALALHRHRVAEGWRATGRKIGFTNRTIWPRYGVYEPIWGTVYDRTTVGARDHRADVALSGLVQPRIEPEICFGLKSAPPRTRDPEELLASIDWVAHSIEIVQCHHPKWKVTLADSTTDNGLHGRLVVGARVPVSNLRDLAEALPRLQIALRKGQTVVDRGVGANVLDSPLLALAFLVEVLFRDSEADPLAAGEIISTGTLTDAHPVAPGDIWSTELTGLPLPGLTVRFT